MKTLKITYTNLWPEWSLEDFITPILQQYYNVVIDNRYPDVVFHSIFNGQKGIQQYRFSNAKKILILAENHRTNNFPIATSSMSFDLQSHTNYYLPLWQMYMLKWPRLLDMLTNRYTHTTYTNFCSFTVSNPSNHIRKLYADTLSTYKQVDGYGKVCNTSNALDSLNGYWRESKLEYFQEHPHKFSLVMENSSNVGYTTEKLMDSFLSRSIPIYWGDPLVTQWFNPNAFINIPDHNWIDYVKQLDQDEELFNKKMNEPIFTTSQLHKLQLNLHNFEGWLLNQL